jgi:hypothetical protein
MDRVTDHGFAFSGNAYVEAQAVAVLFKVTVTCVLDFPIGRAVQIFQHGDIHGTVLVVPQADFERFPHVSGSLVYAEIGLFALAHHIEGISHLDQDVFVPGRVADDVFTDEFQASIFRVELVDANPAGGQRDAELL